MAGTSLGVEEPTRVELAPAGTHATDELIRPNHIDEAAVLGPFVHCKGKATLAVHDYKYWSGDAQPWRNGLDDTPVTDPDVIASEEQYKLEAEVEDQPTAGTPAHAEKLRECGVRLDFLLVLTFALDMWEWKTWEVVQYLVKPATEGEGRCRFTQLVGVRGYAGAATVFMSHCWGGRWGDLVAAACAGADTNRTVWIDVFAVRQWPGNGADLDFRGVLEGCTAAIVAAAPIDETLTSTSDEESMRHPLKRRAFVKSEEYAAVAKVLPFCRLWCVVEMAAVLGLGKPLIFWSGKVMVAGGGGGGAGGGEAGRVKVSRKGEAIRMLTNCVNLVDVAAAQCAVPADKARELATIGAANFEAMNRTVAAALSAGHMAARASVSEVDAFDCGERGPLRELEKSRVWLVFYAACAAGQLAVLVELWKAHAEAVAAYLAGEGWGAHRDGAWQPVHAASKNGRLEVVKWLVGEAGASAEAVRPASGSSAVLMAAEKGHHEVVKVLLGAGASVDLAEEGDGDTPLVRAAYKGYLEGVKALLEAGASVHHTRKDGATPLLMAAQEGHLNVVKALLEAGADVSISMNETTTECGRTPLISAACAGHAVVVAELLQHGADRSTTTAQDNDEIPAGSTALLSAQLKGHQGVVDLLR